MVMEKDFKILNKITPENANPYSTPVGYFEGLADEVLFKIKTKATPYSIPQNYFNDISTSILSKIKLGQEKNEHSELETIAPLLHSIKKINVYTVPDKYFESFEVQPKKMGKVVSLSSKWIKIVAAAAVVGIVSVVALMMQNQNINSTVDFQASLQNISDNELKNELNIEKTILGIAEENVATYSWQNIGDLKNEIQFITDEEMDFYLKENSLSEEQINFPNS